MGSLDALFSPKSIAVVGASADPNKLGYVLLKNVVDYGFRGNIYPINPKADEILGLKMYPHVNAIPEQIDLALVSIPGALVLEIIEECAHSGVKAAVILSSGFGEATGEGQEVQSKISNICKSTGMRVMGPNCMGIYNTSSNLNGTYFWELPRPAPSFLAEGKVGVGGEGVPANISFVSQSGAYGGILFNEVRQRKIGINKFASIGNMADITHTDIIRYLADDPDTEVIALFVEGIKNGREFMDVASQIPKPIVAFKAGRTEAGKRAVKSHTGAMAGSIEVYEAAFRQAGVILAKTSEEFFDVVMALSSWGSCLPSNNNVGILTISGGPCVIASDVCEEIGLPVPKLNTQTREQIRKYIPFFGADSNPVDMTPQMNPANYEACVDVIFSQNEIGGVIAINVGLDQPEFASAFVKASKKYNKPVVSFTIDTPKLSQIFYDNNIPIYPTPERSVYAYNGLVRYSEHKNKRRKPKTESREPVPESSMLKQLKQKTKMGKASCLTGYQAMQMLQECGIPICKGAVAENIEEAVKCAKNIGYPVVVKIESPDVLHKTERGGVFLNLKTETEVVSACKKIKNNFGFVGVQNFEPLHDFIVQQFIPSNYELIIGGKRDPNFGPTILIGMGGILTEVLKDFSLRVCPIDKYTAIEMVQELKGYPILKGYRGQAGCDIEHIAEVLLKVSDLLTSNSEIKELDINPLIIHNNKLVAVDGLLLLS